LKARVHIVEDNPANMELLCDWLETEGHEVVASKTLSEATRDAQQQAPQIVLLDVELGNENGLDFASWLRQQPELQHVPVIAVTAHAMATDRERILRAGCNGYLPKPVDFQQLREILRRWLPLSAEG
jgi:two-component system cell cycle response regulator DivK